MKRNRPGAVMDCIEQNHIVGSEPVVPQYSVGFEKRKIREHVEVLKRVASMEAGALREPKWSHINKFLRGNRHSHIHWQPRSTLAHLDYLPDSTREFNPTRELSSFTKHGGSLDHKHSSSPTPSLQLNDGTSTKIIWDLCLVRLSVSRLSFARYVICFRPIPTSCLRPLRQLVTDDFFVLSYVCWKLCVFVFLVQATHCMPSRRIWKIRRESWLARESPSAQLKHRFQIFLLALNI